MHARMTTLDVSPDRLDDAIRQLEQEDVPRFRQQQGFKGFTLLVDRQGGTCVGTTYWESEDDLRASEEVGREARERAAQSGGAAGEPSVGRFEVAIDTMEQR